MRIDIRILATFLLLSLGLTTSTRADEPGIQVEKELKTDAGTIPYLLCLPKDYKESDKVPLILFLHGRGESYGPLRLVEKWGPPKMAARGDDLPYIVVSPQCPKDDRWSSDTQQTLVVALLEHVIANYKVDDSRVYLTGLSMGGYGSWTLAAQHADRFAAAAIICGGGDPSKANQLTSLPIWVFHGDQDRAVPFKKSVEMVDAIKKAGGEKVRFTSLENIGHNSWSATYATPELYQWFNKHTRN